LAEPPLRIVIDPGHGGQDQGAVVGKAKESEIAFSVSQALYRRLESNPQFVTSLTRTKDQMLSLSERIKKADQFKADLFVSIHANASSDFRARGVEIYFQNQLPVSEESLYLAAIENKAENSLHEPDTSKLDSEASDVQAILADLSRSHRTRRSFELARALAKSWGLSERIDSHSVRQAPFYVITQNNRPSLLIELGFLTNPGDVRKLTDSRHQDQLAQKIYDTLVGFHQAKTPVQVP
jgi:N-acetylmuramoyl-L-alanine amidase